MSAHPTGRPTRSAAQDRDAGGWIPNSEGWLPNPEWTAEECLRVALGKLSVHNFPNETTRDKIRIQRVWEARRCLSAALSKIEDAYERGYRDAVDLYSSPRRA